MALEVLCDQCGASVLNPERHWQTYLNGPPGWKLPSDWRRIEKRGQVVYLCYECIAEDEE